MRSKWFVAVVCLLLSTALRGEVTNSTQAGFTIKIVTRINGAPEDVYNRLVHHVGDWWSSDHTLSHDAHNLFIDDKVMGCFCEKLPNGGGVRWTEVTMVMPNKMLIMSGALGPLQRMGVIGTLTFVLNPMHTVTTVEVTYAVGGYLPEGLQTWAAPVDKVLTEQMARLKKYVETGSPEPPAKKQ